MLSPGPLMPLTLKLLFGVHHLASRRGHDHPSSRGLELPTVSPNALQAKRNDSSSIIELLTPYVGLLEGQAGVRPSETSFASPTRGQKATLVESESK